MGGPYLTLSLVGLISGYPERRESYFPLEHLDSIESQTRAAMSGPLKRRISWMPVGEVTLISVR